MKIGKLVIALVLGLCLTLALAQPALAGLTVAGAKIEAEVTPGSDYTATIIATNTSDVPMDIAAEVKGYGISPSGSLRVLEPEEDKSPYTARGFITVSPAVFCLDPGDSQDVTVTIKTPADVGDGARYAVVYIHTVPSAEHAITVISGIAARVLLTISGSNLVIDSEVTEVSLGKLTSPESAEATVTVANKGNYHYKPQVNGKLRKPGKVVATCPPVTTVWPLLPGCSRQFKLGFVADEPLLLGKYEVDIEVRDEAGKLLAEHTSSLELTEEQVLPEKPPPEPAPPTAVVPPTTLAKPIDWRLIGAIAGGALILGLLIFLLARRRA